MCECLLGIDVGTTNTKAAAYDKKGRLLKKASVPSLQHQDKDGLFYLPEELWQGVCSCVRTVLSELKDPSVLSVGISSFGEAGVPLDKNEEALYPIIVWHDPRSQKQAGDLEKRLTREKIYSITGQVSSSKFGITKLLWILENIPGVREKMTIWLSMSDYINFRLSGEKKTDYSLASRTMAFDIHKKAWSGEILRGTGITAEMFPEPLSAATLMGRVSAGAAAATGLPEGCPVSIGGHDHACTGVAAGVVEDGVVLDSMGTAEAIMMAFDEPRLTGECLAQFISFYPHCGKKLYRAISGYQGCGASLEWFAAFLGGGIKHRADAAELPLFQWLDTLAGAEQSTDLLYLPHINGCDESPSMGGAFMYLKKEHQLRDFMQAILEGTSLEMAFMLERFAALGPAPKKLRVAGGGAKSVPWMEIKSRISGHVVEVVPCEDAAIQGAAILGAVAAGLMTLEEAVPPSHEMRRYEIPGGPRDRELRMRYQRARELTMEFYESWNSEILNEGNTKHG
jgi:xylulokinase